MTIRVALADDHPLLRTGIGAMLALEDDICLLGEAVDGCGAQRLVNELQPDILLLDVSMPGPPVLETIEYVHKHSPETKILVLTAYDNSDLVCSVMAAGVAGYLLKDESNEVVVKAIRVLAHGGSWLSRSVFTKLTTLETHESCVQRTPPLTPREYDVLQLLVSGKTDFEISQLLHLSERTVRRGLRDIYNKLGVNTRVEAAILAIRLELTV